MATKTLHVKPLSPKIISTWPSREVENYFKKSFELAKQERAAREIARRSRWQWIYRFFGMN